jgi:hypothetical protein
MWFGLDVVLDIENHYAETREAPGGPRNLLKGMIAERKLAVKSGVDFMSIKMIIVRHRIYATFDKDGHPIFKGSKSNHKEHTKPKRYSRINWRIGACCLLICIQ